MIGNKHFKTWLKGLDPVTRVEKMRDIAKSQAITGLKGSLIKESLAQLSQKCQVMLIKLTPDDISHYSRKSQVKVHDNSKISISKMKDYTKIHKNKKESLTKLHNKGDVSIFKSPSKHNSRFEQKIRDLFGEDPVDMDTYSNVKSGSDKNINQYVSNTVNVTIFKSSSRSHDETGQISTREITAGTGLPNKVPNKILRIDVSLCNEDSNIKSNLNSISTSDCKNDQNKCKTVGQISKTKRKLSCDLKSRNFATKTKRKKKSHKNHHGSSSLNEDEDPSIEELWKILGMESPTDRSESIIKSYPLPTQGPSSENPQGTLNHNVLILSSTTDKANYSNNKPQEAHVTDNSSQNSATGSALSSLQYPENAGPVREIDQAFSPSSKHQNKTTITNSLSEETVRSSKESFDPSQKEDINIVTLLNDDIDNSNAVEVANKIVNEKLTLKNSKVGTIRVRDIGSLMKHPSPHNNTTLVANSSKQPSTSGQLSTSINSTNDKSTIADQFILIYRYYFDELVESKIPKMGELLHLAIADLQRKKERIKRAEQLSSDELIVEEKQRAEKEINDMMRVRGVELTSLCGTIINRFDQSSRITLFIALFSRLLKHAQYIDPANKQHTLEAKNVMYMMLTKANFKDKDIVEWLTCDFVKFSRQLEHINNYINMFNEQINAVNNLNKQLNVPQTNDSLLNPRSIACEPQPLQSKLTPAVSPVGNVTLPNASLNIMNNMPQIRLNSEGVLRSEFQTNEQPSERFVKPMSQLTVASESQSKTPQPTFKASQMSNLTATNSTVNPDRADKILHARLYNEYIQNESRINETLVTPNSQPNGPQSLQPYHTSPVSNRTSLSEGRVYQFAVKPQPDNRNGRPTIYKALIQNKPQTNSGNMLQGPQPTIAGSQSPSPKTLPSVTNCTYTKVNMLNNKAQFPFKEIASKTQLEQNKRTTTNLHSALMLLKNADNARYERITNAGKSTRSYLVSSTSALQPRERPELASISQIRSNVHNVQMAKDLIIRSSPTSAPNNAVTSPQIHSHLYTQYSPNRPSLTITPVNTHPNISSASSTQLETVIQRNWQDHIRPGNGLINVPQTPKRSPINLSSGPTSSINVQERVGATVPQVQPIISAIESVDTSSSSQTDLLQNKQPQGPVPSSSHCHPFVRRMPISGKMRMLFGNPNSID